MNQQVQELLKKKDIQGSLEILRHINSNAKLVYADYMNEKKLLQMQYIDKETWQAYVNELFIRIKQLDEELDDNTPVYPRNLRGEETKKDTDAKPRVFISYNNLDQEIVNKISMYFQKEYIDFFVDNVLMIPGDIIKDRVSKEIMERDYFLILLSKNSLKSPWVCLEGVLGSMKAQWMKGKLIPIRTDGSLDDIDFLATLPKTITKKINEIDFYIEKIRKYGPGRKHLDTERELYVEFIKHYDTMLDTYRKTANINISGNLFEKGMQNLMRTIRAVS